MTVSAVIVTYNNAEYIPTLMGSLRSQTVFDEMEVFVLDNDSKDETVKLCREHSAGWNKPLHIEVLGNNKGYTVANNIGAARASGNFVFILNADIWLAKDCVERLLQAIQATGSDAASSQVASLTDSGKTIPQPLYFDIFGRPSWKEEDANLAEKEPWTRCFMFGGPGFLVRREVWNKIGGFDTKHFMYAEDDDISWKLWLAGHQAVHVRTAILHHRNPMENGSWEIGINTRYLVNRNSLLVIAKNGKNLLLLCLPLQMMMLAAETVFFLCLTRDWKFVKKSYIMAVIDFFKMWPHIKEQRKFISSFRRRSDWEMIRLFFTIRVNRWDMIKAFFLKGIKPKVKQTKTTT